MLADLYRYERKSTPVALTLALTTGVLGGHRFYLGKTFTGLAMFLSGGGALFWLIWDLFQIRQMVAAYNAEEIRREQSDLPPRALAFLPPRSSATPQGRPKWARKRQGRATLLGSMALLLVLGFLLGTTAGATELWEPIVIVFSFILTTLLCAQWQGMNHAVGLRALSRWAHRLRLFYWHADPGSLWLMSLRPLMGVFLAPFQRRARAEVRLYLQLGLAFSTGLSAMDLPELLAADSWAAALGIWLAEFLQTLIYTYLFVAPIGAILTTQLLLQKRDTTVWGLSALVVVSVALGLAAVGRI